VTRRKVENNKWGIATVCISTSPLWKKYRVFNLHQDEVNWDHTGMENWGDHQFKDSFLDELHVTVGTSESAYKKRLESAE
jgi:hypothetical protein